MTTSTTYNDSTPAQPVNSASRVATASFIGTAIAYNWQAVKAWLHS